MALFTAPSTNRRSIALLAFPLAAVIGACASCAAAPPQALEASPNAISSADPTTTSTSTPDAPAQNGSSTSGNTAPKKATSTAEASKKPSRTEKSPDAEATVAPLASGARTGASIKALASSSPTLTAATNKLFDAAKIGGIENIKQAIADGADLSATDNAGRTALMLSVVSKSTEGARLIFEAGANPNTKDAYHESPFLRASANGMIGTLKLFINGDANVREVNRMGSTALSIASENSQLAAVRALLATDTPVDHVNDLGWTALHETIVLGQGTNEAVTIARLLVNSGANPYLEDHSGSNAFELAQERDQAQMLSMLQVASKR